MTINWMKAGNTAVITGSAGGIGYAAAQQYVRAGMNVAMLDMKDNLEEAAAELQKTATGAAKVLAIRCDVSQYEQMVAASKQVADELGNVHCLMNNAGIVTASAKPWDGLDILHKIFSVNFYGVIHGCTAFVGDMLAHGEAGAVINTGSKQGITKPPGNFAYNLSKTGVVAYTESLSHALVTEENCNLSAHLLVPGFVYTPMVSAFIPEKPAFAATAEETVSYMLQRLAEGDFYILCPDNDVPTRDMDERRIQWSVDDIIKNRPALSRWHPDYKTAFDEFMSKK